MKRNGGCAAGRFTQVAVYTEEIFNDFVSRAILKT
tara:strand:+ start:323 stop:427 length:105 start_codon:yes stop_codon:yes gene_type:complete